MNTQLYTDCLNCDFPSLFAEKGFSYFIKGNYNLNIIGVRSKESVHQLNRFDDIIVVQYKINNDKYIKIFSATTDPGLSQLKKPINNKGTAILVPGQYRGCWTIGKHKGQYDALVQYKPVKVYRDNNKDDIFDFNPETIDNGMFGINIHKAGDNSTIVDGWSAGCQVISRRGDFDIFMALCREQVKQGMGKTFTYTLFEEKDIFNYIK